MNEKRKKQKQKQWHKIVKDNQKTVQFYHRHIHVYKFMHDRLKRVQERVTETVKENV